MLCLAKVFPSVNFVIHSQELGDFKFPPFSAAKLTFFPISGSVSFPSIPRVHTTLRPHWCSLNHSFPFFFTRVSPPR